MRIREYLPWVLGGLLALGCAGAAEAAPNAAYTKQGDVSPSGISLRDIAVNRNPNSPYYGYVYAANASDAKVRILRPDKPEDGSSAADLVDTGLTITPSAGTNNTFGVAVGADDSVWLGVFSTGNIETAPPVPPAGTDVNAKKQFTITGGIRGIGVSGTLGSAHVWIQTTDVKAKYWTGGTSAWNTTGTFSERQVVDLTTISLNVQVGYGLGVDSSGNAYVGLSHNKVGSALRLIAKVGTNGVIDSSWGGKRPAFTTIANSLADAEVVEDSRLPGGGYVYWGGRQVTGGVHKRLVHRYRLDNGAWLDSFGPGKAMSYAPPTDETYAAVDVSNSTSPYYFGADDKGNLYLNSGDQTKVTKVAALPPYEASDSVAAGGAVYSAPTAYSGRAYFGADDGKLHGYAIASGAALSGFPLDLRPTAGASARILGRPALRVIGGQAFLFFLTDNGFIGRVGLTATGDLDATPGVSKLYQPDATAAGVSTTPAVFSIGGTDYIFAALNTSGGAKVFKVPANAMNSYQFHGFGAGTTITSSPAGGAGTNIYIGIAGSVKGVLRVDAANLTVMTSFASSENVSGSPYISHTSNFFSGTPVMYVGTDSGNVHAVNAINASTLSGFGASGVASVAPGIALTSVYLHGNDLYTTGKTGGGIYRIAADTGAAEQIYNTASEANGVASAGLVVDPKDNGYLVFGTDTGHFYQLDADNPHHRRIHWLADSDSGFTTPPAIDAVSGKVVVGNADSNVYIYAR